MKPPQCPECKKFWWVLVLTDYIAYNIREDDIEQADKGQHQDVRCQHCGHEADEDLAVRVGQHWLNARMPPKEDPEEPEANDLH